MKKHIFIYFIAVSLLFALEIKENKLFNKSITPEKMVTSFSVEKVSLFINEIESSLSAISEKVKESNICSGGTYSIVPVYSYQNRTKEFENYKGVMNFNCTFSKIQDFDLLMNSFSLEDEKLSLSPINWHVGKKESEAVKEELKKGALQYSILKAAKLSSHLGSYKCEPKEIIFNDRRNQPYPRNLMYAQSSMEKASIEPIKEDQKISLNVDFSYECIKK